MAVTSARNIVDNNLQEKGHFEHDNERIIEKYTLADKLPSQLKELNLRPRNISKPAYSLRKLTTSDKEPVIEFLRNFMEDAICNAYVVVYNNDSSGVNFSPFSGISKKELQTYETRFFFRDEPLNLTINLLETPESRCFELEDYAASTLQDGVSVAVVDDQGNFVGMVINGIARREEVDYTDKSEECPHPKFKKILKLLNYLDREAAIWEKLPPTCDTVLEIRIASTHTDWRGRGLMRVLCEESERIAKEIDAGALRMDTTSAFSAAAAERLHYKSVLSVLYSEIPYAPQPDPPHSEARVYLKQI